MFGRRLAWSAAAVAAAAGIGGVASADVDSAWYAKLRKPDFQPPREVFPIAWTALYADIAVTTAVATDTMATPEEVSRYRRAVVTNLVLNGAWTWVFFKSHRLLEATLVAGALTVSSADLVRRTAQVSPGAAVALSPYAGWCAFATALSAEIWYLNR